MSGQQGEHFPWGLAAWTAAVVAFLILPLLVIVVFSFNSRDLTALPLEELTLKWYMKLFVSTDLINALVNSFIVAAIVSVLATVIGTLAAIGLVRSSARATSIMRPILSMPMMTPRLVVGIALLSLYNIARIDLSLATVVFGHTVIAIPYVVLVVSARLVGLDPHIEEAAYDLGTRRIRVIIDILLPVLRPSIIGAALIAFTLSFDEVVIAFFTTGNDSTLPVAIWAMLRFGITPEINAISTITMTLTVLTALVAEVIIRRTRGSGPNLDPRRPPKFSQ